RCSDLPPPTSAMTKRKLKNSEGSIHSASAVSSLTSPPPIAPAANSPARTAKVASATPTCRAMPGHGSSPVATQNSGAARAIAPVSQLPMRRLRRSVTAATTSAIAKATSRPYLKGSSSIGTPQLRGHRASAQDLPKSNHWREAGISQVTKATAATFDRRAMPPGAVEQRWVAPDGYPIRRLDWKEPEGFVRGSLLFMPGRGDAYEKYLETFEHWRSRGWRVTSADWRGQAGSGRLGNDAVTGHVDDFALWIRDLAALWRAWAAEREGPRVLVGHSMGGHLALRALAERGFEPVPAALILSAPMLDVHPEWLPSAAKALLVRVMCRVGDPRRPAWKWSEKPGEVPAFRQD